METSQSDQDLVSLQIEQTSMGDEVADKDNNPVIEYVEENSMSEQLSSINEVSI